jgi:hypothetical protein
MLHSFKRALRLPLFALFAASACGDGEVPAGPPYALCDGTDEVRLFLRTFRGGAGRSAEQSFLAPLGERTLLVTGTCSYLTRLDDGSERAGTLSEAEAAQLADLLQLSELGDTSFREGADANCPDPNAWLLSSHDADVSCLCGCGPSVPKVVRAAAEGNEDAFALAERADGAPPSGPVEVVVVHDASTSSAAVAWPLSVSAASLAVEPSAFIGTPEAAVRRLEGSDAELARTLAATASPSPWPTVTVVDAGESYTLLVRNPLPAAFAEAALYGR